MKRYKIILVLAIWGAIICAAIIGIVFNRGSEEERLIAAAMNAQKKMLTNTNPGLIERFLGYFIDRPTEMGYWTTKYYKAVEELANKGYLKRDSITLSKETWNKLNKKGLSDISGYKLALRKSSSFGPDDPNRTITFIGPAEYVDKSLKRIRELINSNGIEGIPQ